MSGGWRVGLRHQAGRPRAAFCGNARVDFATFGTHTTSRFLRSRGMSSPSRQVGKTPGSSVSAPGGQREEAPRDKVKILLVDDNPDNLVSIEAALDTLNEDLVLGG